MLFRSRKHQRTRYRVHRGQHNPTSPCPSRHPLFEQHDRILVETIETPVAIPKHARLDRDGAQARCVLRPAAQRASATFGVQGADSGRNVFYDGSGRAREAASRTIACQAIETRSQPCSLVFRLPRHRTQFSGYQAPNRNSNSVEHIISNLLRKGISCISNGTTKSQLSNGPQRIGILKHKTVF